MIARTSGKVGIGHLPMADDTAKHDQVVWSIVRPELVAFMAAHTIEDRYRIRRIGASTKQEAQERPLRRRCGREFPGFTSEPVDDDIVVHMIRDGQRHEHISVEQDGQDSSSRLRTSSDVTILPTWNTGKPVLGSRSMFGTSSAMRAFLSSADTV